MCEGEFDLVTPRVWRLRLQSPRKIPVTCKEKCDTRDLGTTASGSTLIHWTSGKVLDSEHRAGRELNIVVRGFCYQQDGDRVFKGSTRIKIVFGPRGLVDRRRSDLDGDGDRDGR